MGNIKAGSKTIYKNQSEDKKHFFCRFVEYVFISTNSWFLGKLKTVKTTLIILPRSLIRQIEEQGRKLEVKLIKGKKSSPYQSYRSVSQTQLMWRRGALETAHWRNGNARPEASFTGGKQSHFSVSFHSSFWV